LLIPSVQGGGDFHTETHEHRQIFSKTEDFKVVMSHFSVHVVILHGSV